MITAWTAHLDTEEDQEKFRRIVSSAKMVLDRLKTIIEDRQKVIDMIETSVEIYTKPGWDALLAHYNGEKAALKYMKKIVDLDQQKEYFNGGITAGRQTS